MGKAAGRAMGVACLCAGRGAAQRLRRLLVRDRRPSRRGRSRVPLRRLGIQHADRYLARARDDGEAPDGGHGDRLRAEPHCLARRDARGAMGTGGYPQGRASRVPEAHFYLSHDHRHLDRRRSQPAQPCDHDPGALGGLDRHRQRRSAAARAFAEGLEGHSAGEGGGLRVRELRGAGALPAGDGRGGLLLGEEEQGHRRFLPRRQEDRLVGCGLQHLRHHAQLAHLHRGAEQSLRAGLGLPGGQHDDTCRRGRGRVRRVALLPSDRCHERLRVPRAALQPAGAPAR